MKDKSNGKSTERMWAMLLSSATLDSYMDLVVDKDELPAFPEYISKLCVRKKEKPEQIMKNAHLEKSYGYKLFSGARNPSRDTALQLAFGLGLDLDETQQLLKIARVALLHPKIKRDAIITFCLMNHINLTDTQIILQKKGFPVLGGKRNESG